MSEQLNMEQLFGDKIVSVGEPHLACALLLDVSGSMYGSAIDSLNQGIKRFKQQVMSDPIARQRVDIALVSFASDVQVVSDFVTISKMPTPVLQAGGATEMAEGIQTAIDLVKQRTKMYSDLGTPCHKPWIFMITDGVATSTQQEMVEAAERIHLEETKGSHRHMTFWALGLKDYDKGQLFSLTNRVMELQNQDFSGIFDWLSESMSTISKSRVDERVQFDPLPNNANVVSPDWY